MHQQQIDYRKEIEDLGLKAKTKKGSGFAKIEKLEKSTE